MSSPPAPVVRVGVGAIVVRADDDCVLVGVRKVGAGSLWWSSTS